MENVINQIRTAIAEGNEFKSIELAYGVQIKVLAVSTIAVMKDGWAVAIEI